jgi:class 3 adenylate cyclase/tetratricopeptide (TPR) repeat protein
VTVLFCDLVGFTAASQDTDPEDVRARIRPYHSRLRQEIERYGGTVEKFIGDAVMAVFGAPVAHEDDAERAVRVGLRILEAIEDLNAGDPALSLQVRIGINTGEAVVTLGARPEEGEGIVTGDVVNTASRLQSAAPVSAIAVSEQTYRATGRVFYYEELDPVAVKGKTEPLALYRPLAPRARLGSDVTRTHTTPLVGRELEKPLLIGTFERSATQRSCQLVALVGEPGVGKSRLCAELFDYVERRPGLVRWRHGRCLPYGEGIAFWALGEIIKAECEILESDPPAEADRKLERALPADDPDVAWLKARLQTLLGTGGGPASREESFTAWRRFLEALAAERPTVLVFEDLHWADEALLAFLEHVADWCEGVPLLLLCTARPELYERHPGFGATARNAQRINLAPLSDDETAGLIAALLDQAVLPLETQRTLLERAGGNPLYAEEFVRLLGDRDERGEAVEVPDSVQALIAARLDTLSPERKSLLQDASVFGKDFWAGALAEMAGREPRAVELALHELSRKELVRLARTSSMAGEAEYSFWHVLVRDVCYAQIPRLRRSELHRGAADWFESLGRPEDHAETIGHHRLTALELARAAGAETVELERSARFALREAGDRALTVNAFSSAVRYFQGALELWPDDADLGYLLFAYGRALWSAEDRGEATLLEARDRLVAAGDGETAAEALLVAVDLFMNRGQRDVARAHLEEAVASVAGAGVSRALVLAKLAQFHMLGGDTAAALSTGEEALVLATELGLDPIRAHVLNTLGTSRVNAGDRGGLDQLQESLELSLALNSVPDILRGYNNLSHCFEMLGELARSGDLLEEGIRAADRYGERGTSRVLRANRPLYYVHAGDWEDAMRFAEEFIAEVDGGLPSGHAQASLSARGHVRWGRDDVAGAISDVERALEIGRGHGSPDHLAGELAMLAHMLVEAGNEPRAHGILDELLELVHNANMPDLLAPFEAVLAFRDLGRTNELDETLERGTSSPANEAARLAAAGHFSDAAEIYERAGDFMAAAELRLRAAQELVASGRRLEGDVQLEKSLAFWRRAGATRYIRESEALLAPTA